MEEPGTATSSLPTPPSTRPTPGLRIGIFNAPAGITTLAPLRDHLISIHVGAPVRVACRYAGRAHQRLQAHGDIDVVPAGVAGIWEDETAATALTLRIPPALLNTAAAGLGLSADRVVVAPQYQLRDPQIEHIGWALKAELEAGHPGGQLYAESLGLALATRLLHLGSASTFPASNKRHALADWQQRRVIEYIEAHLDQDLSLSHLAGVAGVSASHFKAIFRQSLGLPVHQYIIRRRVDRARALLLEGQLPLCQVALESGFAHQSHMARWMRRLLDTTPTDLVRSRR